jgi:hypothetical protein
MSPCATNLTTKAAKTIEIAGNRVIIEITLYGATKPAPYRRHRLMPPTQQRFPNRRECDTHALLNRQARKLEIAQLIPCAHMGEAEEIECFRLAQPSPQAVGYSVFPELD